MLKRAETLPVKTRLPRAAWILAGAVTLLSLMSSLLAEVQVASPHILASIAPPI
jgi:hypothetical protein